MTKTSSLENLLQVQHGDLHTVIPPLVAESGARRAASELGVSQAWVYRWLKRNGYRRAIAKESGHGE